LQLLWLPQLVLQVPLLWQRKMQLPPGQVKVQSALPSHVMSQPPPAQSLLHVLCSPQVETHLPPAHCELQLAMPLQWLWHSPDAQVASQLALPPQLWEQSAAAQSWLQLLELPQVISQSPPAAHVSWQWADVLQARLQLTEPLQLAVQSLLPPQVFVHCLAGPCGSQPMLHVWASVQLPLPLITTGGAPPVLLPPEFVPALPLPPVPPLSLPPLVGDPPPGSLPPVFVPALVPGSPPMASVPAWLDWPALDLLPAWPACLPPWAVVPALAAPLPPLASAPPPSLAAVAALPWRPSSLKMASRLVVQAAPSAPPTMSRTISLTLLGIPRELSTP
jgi:hypothetical protein